MKFEIAANKILGSRKVQEDSWRLRTLDGRDITAEAERQGGVQIDNGVLVVLADGMGGHGGGDVASRIACERFSSAYFTGNERPPSERLEAALKSANGAIADAKAKDGLLKQMGCTLVAAHLATDKMTFVSVGDSLLIRVRGNEVHRVNDDHSNHLALDLRALETDSEDAWKLALNDQQRYSITSAVTGKPLSIREIDSRRMESGDILIFATDGLETLDYQQIRAIVAKRRDKGVAAVRDWLLKATQMIGASGRQDKTTVIVVRSVNGAQPAIAESDLTQVRGTVASGIEADVTEIRPIPIAPEQARTLPASGGAGASALPGGAARPSQPGVAPQAALGQRGPSPRQAQPGQINAPQPGGGSRKALLIAALSAAGLALAAAGGYLLTRAPNQINNALPQTNTTAPRTVPPSPQQQQINQQPPAPAQTPAILTPPAPAPAQPPVQLPPANKSSLPTPPKTTATVPAPPSSETTSRQPAPSTPSTTVYEAFRL